MKLKWNDSIKNAHLFMNTKGWYVKNRWTLSTYPRNGYTLALQHRGMLLDYKTDYRLFVKPE